MRRVISVLLATGLAACGGATALEGTLVWTGMPTVSGHSAHGAVRNTTSHSVSLDPHSMRLLDSSGRKLGGRFRVSMTSLPKGATAQLAVTWKTGNPVRIDYGSGTLPLPSP